MSEDMLAVNRMLVAFLVYALVLIRCGCLVLFAPFFGSELFPSRFRLAFVGGFSLLLVPAAARTAQLPPTMDVLDLALLAGQELSIGITMGFMASLVFTGAQLAGEIAGQQIGFSMANVVDPMSNIEVPLLGFINMNLAMVLFITAKLHLILVYLFMQSFEFIGLGALVPEIALGKPGDEGPVYLMSLVQAQGLLILGVQLAIPVMLVMLLNSVVEGFITKTMPQMNIMVLGMPLRVVIGVSALIFIYPAICGVLVPADWMFNLRDMPDGPLGDMLVDLSLMIRQMGGR